MKASFALLLLMLINISIASSQSLPDQRSMQHRFLEPPPLSRQVIVLAQADEKGSETSYQQTLGSFLEREDFAAAEKFVDDLSEETDVSPVILRSLRTQIRSVRTARLIEYAQMIRKAVASSDMDAVNEYSQRMQRLKIANPKTELSSSQEIETYRPKETSHSVQETRDTSEIDKTKNGGPSPIAEETNAIRQIRAALDEDRLLLPANDNAFDLAAARLTEKPDDADASNLLEDVIGKQQSKALANLDSGRPETALELTSQLIEAVERLDAETEAPSSSKSSALRWAEEIKPEIMTGLIANTEAAIEQLNLSIAPEGKLSAEGNVGLLAAELGKDHDDVQRLANDITDRYQSLIDDRLGKRQYESASTFHTRMETIAERFGLPTDQMAEQGLYIAALPARQQEHDQLLLQAAQWRDRGQLIEPEGANALEFAARAVRLAFNPEAAEKAYNDVIVQQRKRIDLLVNNGRFEEAARQLQQWGTVTEQVGPAQSERANEYYAEADQILERADREKERQRAEAAKRARAEAAAAAELSESNDAPFTFVNPF